MNLLTKISMYYLRRQQNKQANKKLTEEQQKKKEIAEGFRKLYHFVHWLNTKGLANRHQRKAFWRNVREGQPVLEKVILQLVERYEVKQPDIKVDPKKMAHIVKGAELGKPREPKEEAKKMGKDKRVGLLPVKNLLKTPEMKPPKVEEKK